jgi:hypothetical protein
VAPRHAIHDEAKAVNLVGKRGRPAVFADDWLERLPRVRPDLKSRRGLQDQTYATEAFTALEQFKCTDLWRLLVCPNEWHVRNSLLAQLGRYRNPDLIREVAQLMYEQVVRDGGRLNVKKRIKVLRVHRVHRRNLFSEAASENTVTQTAADISHLS